MICCPEVPEAARALMQQRCFLPWDLQAGGAARCQMGTEDGDVLEAVQVEK